MLLLQLQQELFDVQAGTVTGQLFVCTDNAMARDNDADRVMMVGLSNCAEPARRAAAFGQRLIGYRFAVRDIAKVLPNPGVKLCAIEFYIDVKALTPATKVLIQLHDGFEHLGIKPIGVLYVAKGFGQKLVAVIQTALVKIQPYDIMIFSNDLYWADGRFHSAFIKQTDPLLFLCI